MVLACLGAGKGFGVTETLGATTLLQHYPVTLVGAPLAMLSGGKGTQPATPGLAEEPPAWLLP